MRMSTTSPMSMAPLLLALSATAGAGCGGGEADKTYTIADTPLAGVVGGQPWALGMAETDVFLSDVDSFFADFYSETVAPCAGAILLPATHHLIMHVPTEIGSYDLSFERTASFVVVEQSGSPVSYVTYQGRIVVDEITASVVRGGINLDYDGDNNVNGRFELAVCEAP
jgi:hypothetical protein